MDEGNQVFPQGDSAALLVIEFPSFRDFIDAYSPIISEEGIFIRNADVSESNAFSVGDRVDFEVRLKDDFRLIQGAGEVVWLGPSEAAEGAGGTAIRFHDVDEPSKRLISRLVGNYERDGGKLFEIGPEVAVEDVEPDLAPEPEALAELAAPGYDSELTAENLEASEADELFAAEDEEPAAPVEVESVSLEEVERGKPEQDGSLPDLELPVGLDTIAIPSGLVANLAAEGKDAALGPAVEAEAEALDAVAAEAEEIPEPDESRLELGEVSIVPEDGEASFSEVADPLGSLEPPLGEDFDRSALEAAAVSLDGELGGGGGIPDDIAQVAEELSGVHRFELPEPDETSGIDYAGSASVGPERNTGGRIAALSVVFVLLGAGAFYFGDTILGYLGWGGGDTASTSGQSVGPKAAVVEPASEAAAPEEPTAEVPVGPDSEDSVEAASARPETKQDEPGFEPVRVIVERDSEAPGTADGAEAAAAPDQNARAGAAPAAGVASDPPPAPVAAAASRRVESITWREEGGETIVAIRLNTEISKALVKVVRVRDGAPREVIQIEGIEVPYSPREVVVGSRHVERLRTGLHRSESGSSLHVVADLTGAGVTVLSVEPKGRDILITFS